MQHEPIAPDQDAPLNLRMQRAPFTTRRRGLPMTPILGLLAPLGLLWMAARRPRSYYSAVMLAASGLAVLASGVLAERARCTREAALDDQLEQSFPASDPPSR